MSMVLESDNGACGASMGGDAWAWNALVTHEIRNVMYYLHKFSVIYTPIYRTTKETFPLLLLRSECFVRSSRIGLQYN